MLSLGKLAPGQHAYYVDSVARGAEEYYTGAKEAPGNWLGAGSEASAFAVRSTATRSGTCCGTRIRAGRGG